MDLNKNATAAALQVARSFRNQGLTVIPYPWIERGKHELLSKI